MGRWKAVPTPHSATAAAAAVAFGAIPSGRRPAKISVSGSVSGSVRVPAAEAAISPTAGISVQNPREDEIVRVAAERL